MDNRYLYEVRPNRPINIPGKVGTRRIFVALLTLEEVKTYMQYGHVYRKYADPNKEMVRVTGENMYKLHQDYEEPKRVPAKSVAEALKNAAEKNASIEGTKGESAPKKLNEEESIIKETIPVTTSETDTTGENIDTQEDINDDADVNSDTNEEVVDIQNDDESETETTVEISDVDTEEVGNTDVNTNDGDSVDETVEDDQNSTSDEKQSNNNTQNNKNYHNKHNKHNNNVQFNSGKRNN